MEKDLVCGKAIGDDEVKLVDRGASKYSPSATTRVGGTTFVA